MGLRPSPFMLVRFSYLAEEFASGKRWYKDNPLRWDRIKLNLQATADFDTTFFSSNLDAPIRLSNLFRYNIITGRVLLLSGRQLRLYQGGMRTGSTLLVSLEKIDTIALRPPLGLVRYSVRTFKLLSDPSFEFVWKREQRTGRIILGGMAVGVPGIAQSLHDCRNEAKDYCMCIQVQHVLVPNRGNREDVFFSTLA